MNVADQKQLLDDIEKIILTVRVPRNKALLLFQKGILISKISLQQLYLELSEKCGLQYILTYCLNQDVVENFSFFICKRYILGRYSTPILSSNKNVEIISSSDENTVQP